MRRGVRLRGWRKVATATWSAPRDPQIYGTLEVDASALLAYAHRIRERRGERVTITALVGKAVAHAFAEHPELNVVIRRGRAVPRGGVDVFFQAAADGGRDLTGVIVRDADRKPVTAIAAEIRDAAARIRDGQRVGLGRASPLLDRLPTPLLRVGLRAVGWLVGVAGVDLSALGIPAHPFGSAMVSSVAAFDIEHAYGPLGSYYRVPVLVLVGKIVQRPVAVAGDVVVRPILPLGVTLDHRYLDGAHAGRLAASVKAYCADPGRYEADEGSSSR